MSGRFRGGWLAVVLVAALASCQSAGVGEGAVSAPPESEAVESPGVESVAPGEGEPKVFTGTLMEFAAAKRACLEDRGLTTVDPAPGQDPASFSFLGAGMTDEEQLDAVIACDEELGSPYYAGVPEDELRRRYEARLVQFDCLVGLGMLSGEPMSYELFVADFESSGYLYMWAPGLEIPPELVQGSPGDDCPLSTF